MKTSAGLSTSAWFKKGTAAAGDSIAVPWIMYDNNKLLATSAGSTNIVASNESFGCGIGCVSGNKWDLTGKLRGSIPDFATPLSNTFTHFTDNQENYYTVAASHGNHGEWMNLIIKYDTTLVEKWKFEDRVRQHFVYNLLENGGHFYSSATAYDSSETLSHHIILHDNGTGNALKYFSHPLGKNYATAYIKDYLPGKLFTYGIFNQQIKLGQTTLSANTASISESYIAQVNWNLVGLAEAYGEKTSLTVFPNPSKGNFKIRLPAGKQQCTVVNAIGEVIAEKTIQGPEAEIQIDVTPGIYFLQLKGDKATCLKLVVD
jgi:hypothetical protein